MLVVPPSNFLSCGKILVSLFQSFPASYCGKSPLYVTVQENLNSQESRFLRFLSLVHREVFTHLSYLSPPFYSKKAHTLNLFLRRVFHSPSYFPYRSLRLRSSESKVRGITHIHKCSYIPILCFISLVVCLTTQQNHNLCSKVHVSLY